MREKKVVEQIRECIMVCNIDCLFASHKSFDQISLN